MNRNRLRDLWLEGPEHGVELFGQHRCHRGPPRSGPDHCDPEVLPRAGTAVECSPLPALNTVGLRGRPSWLTIVVPPHTSPPFFPYLSMTTRWTSSLWPICPEARANG